MTGSHSNAKPNPSSIIISGEEQLIPQMKETATAAGAGADPLVLAPYPSAAKVRSFLDWSPDPVAALFVDLSDLSAASDLIRRIRGSHPATALIGVGSTHSTGALLAAVKAGATDYLVPPLEVARLARCLREPRAAVEAQLNRGRTVAFMPAQGGNGASTIALHVAHAASDELGEKTLLVDFDFHSGTVAFRTRSVPEFTVADAVSREDFIEQLWDRATFQWRGVDVLAAPPARRVVLADLPNIRELLTWSRLAYTTVIVDMPAALYSSCWDVLAQCDTVYLVCTPELQSVHLARCRASELLQSGFDKNSLRLVVNRVTHQQDLGPEDIARIVGIPVAWTLGNNYAAVNEAWVQAGLIPPNSPLGRQLRRLTRFVTGKLVIPDSPSAEADTEAPVVPVEGQAVEA